jgi:hypothetical protein
VNVLIIGINLIKELLRILKEKLYLKVYFIFYVGLLGVARRHLKVGGRLVFLYPIYEEEEFIGVESLPNHEGF